MRSLPLRNDIAGKMTCWFLMNALTSYDPDSSRNILDKNMKNSVRKGNLMPRKMQAQLESERLLRCVSYSHMRAEQKPLGRKAVNPNASGDTTATQRAEWHSFIAQRSYAQCKVVTVRRGSPVSRGFLRLPAAGQPLNGRGLDIPHLMIL